ncbi:MAG: class I SAM-dependent methyltransferase [Bacteroidota bacterium]|nr:class I SAM-dependent methyltransferase [Bacteroidota bacterium]
MSTNISFAGSIPENYDRYLGPLLFEPYAKDLIERISSRKFSSVLELACGTGRVTQYLIVSQPDAKIIATDVNPDMLEIAKKKVTGKNIEWKQADMQEIPFDDSSFDLIICQYGVMFVPDKVKAYKEVYRVLKPGGVFLFNTWEKLESNEVVYTAEQIVNSFFKENPVGFYKIPFSYFDEEDIRKELEEGGFKNLSFTRVQKEGVCDTAENAAKGLVEGVPAINAINERDPKLLPVIEKELAATYTKKFGDKPMRSPLNAIVVEAVK